MQCRRPLRQHRRGSNPGRQLLWPARTVRSRRAKNSRRRRHRQRRLDRRLWLARQPQPRRFDGQHRRLSRCRRGGPRPRRQERGRLPRLEGVAPAVDLSRGASGSVQEPWHPRQCGESRTGRDAYPETIPHRTWRCPRRQRHCPGRTGRHIGRYSACRAVPVFGRRAVGQWRQCTASTAASKHRSTPKCSAFNREAPPERGRQSWISDF
ncbi:hypothetical protein ACVINZ_005523 [Mesorhizobium jarvisii]